MGNSLSMGGPAIGSSNIPVDAVRQLANGTVVYIAQHGPYVKMAAAGNKDARYYTGTIAQFSQAKWDQATRMKAGDYAVDPVNLKKRNGTPTNTYLNTLDGKCAGDVGTPSKNTSRPLVQNECALMDTCTGYSYNEKTRSYILHTTDISSGDGQTDWKCQPKASAGACTTTDMKTPPWAQTPGSYAECAVKCLNDPVCQGFAYNSVRKVCQTYGAGENAGNAPVGAQVTTSDTNPTWSCVIKQGSSKPAAQAPVQASPAVQVQAPVQASPAVQVQAPVQVQVQATPSVQAQAAQLAPAVQVQAAPVAAPSGPELKDNWMCINEFSAPVKRFGNDVGCLSLDGKTCLYEYCSKPDSKFPDNPQSLICGNDYMSKLGVTGYESPDGWCSNVNRVLPGATPSPLKPATPTDSPVDTSVVPQPQPSTAFTELGTGFCRTSGMEYPAYEQRQVSEQECANACFQDQDCMGYAISTDGSCQLYNIASATVPRTAKLGDTIEKTDGNPSWKCKVKTPKVPIRGPASVAIANPPLPPMQANTQFEDIQTSQVTQTVAQPQSSADTSSLFAPINSQNQPQSPQYQTQSAPVQPTPTATQVLGKIASTVYAPQIQAYNACSAYFKNYAQRGGTATAKITKTQSTINHQRKILRETLARR